MDEIENNILIRYLEYDEEVDEYWLFKLGLSILLGELYQQTEQTGVKEQTEVVLAGLEVVEVAAVWYWYTQEISWIILEQYK